MSTNGFQAYNSASNDDYNITGGSDNVNQHSYADRMSSTGSNEPESSGADPASSSFFAADYKKHEDLKGMLDNNKDTLKLEAMKRIVSMVARGKDCSDLFPAVVKNVVSKNAEVKKLVFVYLMRYAEEQQDLALLSISTFQRALKDPNQLIRASALRVLSSIRVSVIVPIIMLAIKDGCNDMSAYVRKAAAHAIPKLFSIDEEQKEQLVEVIDKLMADKTTLVAGSAIQAFEEVCPERIDLIHRNFRKLCNILVDVEEWGQVVIINMLTKYARTQFVDPNKDDDSGVMTKKEADFYDEDEDDEEDGKKKSAASIEDTKKPYVMDSDHRLLLRTCRPLLNSRNASVVMAVVQLYYHCAPKSETNLVVKSLVRLLRCSKEVQYVVLSNIASMTLSRRGMFDSFLKSFFVRSNDPTQTKIMKLEILTNLASETSISTILREFQTYVSSSDKEFAAATIQAIGRCASNITEVTDTCLNGLVALMSKRDEVVVAEAVVVIKKLLQMQSSNHKDIIVHMARLVDQIQVPMARASILWLIGEYCDRVPRIAPDVLRKMAKNFIHEEDLVKLQVLNLAAKLCITNPKQTRLLCQYVLNLAKYDQNYDIRDRSRFLRALVLPTTVSGSTKSNSESTNEASAGYLAKYAKKIFLATKPAPMIESTFRERPNLQLGSLSHLLNQRAAGYQELPDWPQVAPDRTVRDVEPVPPSLTSISPMKKQRDLAAGGKNAHFTSSDTKKKNKGFYSSEEDDDEVDQEEHEEEEETEEDSDEESTSGSESEDESEDESGSDFVSSGSESEDEEARAPETLAKKAARIQNRALTSPASPVKKALSKQNSAATAGTGSNSGETESEDSSVSSNASSSSSSEDEPVVHQAPASKTKTKTTAAAAATKEKKKESADLLLLDFDAPAVNQVAPAASVSMLSGMMLTAAPLQPQTMKPSGNLTGGSAEASEAGESVVDLPFVSSTTCTASCELLSRVTGGGLSVVARWSRMAMSADPRLISVEFTLTNHGTSALRNVKLGMCTRRRLPVDVRVEPVSGSQLDLLAGGGAADVLRLLIDFADSTQPAPLVITSCNAHDDSVRAPLEVELKPLVGELVKPVSMTSGEFRKLQARLTGMNEHSGQVDLANNAQLLKEWPAARTLTLAVLSTANLLPVPAVLPLLRFAGRTASTNLPLLLTLAPAAQPSLIKLAVHCEKMTMGSLLLRQLCEKLRDL